MADREIRTEQQVKDKIKAFNKQRAGLLIAFIIFIGLLMFLPTAEVEALPVRLFAFVFGFLLCHVVPPWGDNKGGGSIRFSYAFNASCPSFVFLI